MNPLDIVGKIFKNNEELEFKVLEYQGFNNLKQRVYKIKFVESKYEKENVQRNNLLNGKIKDRLAKSVCGVASLGFAKKSTNKKEYNLWVNMIKRCFDKNCPAYEWYGKKGITVCERWLRFDYFLSDLPLISGYDKDLFDLGKIKLDKDIPNGHQVEHCEKIYSLDSCMFVSHLVNMKESTKRYNTTKSIKHCVMPSGEDIVITNLTDFCKKHKLDYRQVYYVLEGRSSHCKGYKFYYEKV